jgi:hypothetical protein
LLRLIVAFLDVVYLRRLGCRSASMRREKNAKNG